MYCVQYIQSEQTGTVHTVLGLEIEQREPNRMNISVISCLQL